MKPLHFFGIALAGLAAIGAGTYLTDLGQITSLRPNDLFYVVTNSASGGSKSITASNLLEGLKTLQNWPASEDAAGDWSSYSTNALTEKLASNAWWSAWVARTNLARLRLTNDFVQMPQVLSFAGTNVLTDATAGNQFRLTITNAFLLQSPTNSQDGQRITWELLQDAAGVRTMVLGSAFKLGADIPTVVLTTNASKRDFLTAMCNGTNWYVVGFIRGF